MGPAHPGHCRGCGPLSPVGRSGGGSTGRPWSCVDEGKRIMNDGAVTAFLPNFVAFPSLRGLNSSTVQPRRTPRPYGVRRCAEAPAGQTTRRALRVGTWGPVPGTGPVAGMRFPLPALSCPVSAASAASAAAPSPAGRPASAGRAAAAGRTVPAGVARVVPARGRTAPVTDPPAVASVPARARPARPPAAPRPDGVRGAPRPHEQLDQQGCDHDQDDACEHGSTLLPYPGLRPEVPRSNPPSDASPRVDHVVELFASSSSLAALRVQLVA
ncbi:hypothetical protein EV562_109160 [Streptomyces sp. BK208]|nr:hypothetical protein EV562_109160 [Streptomyces sp. BK208]